MALSQWHLTFELKFFTERSGCLAMSQQLNPKKIRTVKPGRRGPVHFKQRDVERLYRAGQRVGMVNPIVEVHPDPESAMSDGADRTLRLVPGELAPREGGNDLDKWLGKHDAHSTPGN